MTFKEAKKITSQGLSEITESAEFEAEQLLDLVTGLNSTERFLNKEKNLKAAEIRKLKKLTEKRRRGTPLQYILGEWEFYGLTFKVGKGVLIPRADTELIVQSAIEYISKSGAKSVFDFCAGSGAIGISVSVNSPTVHVIMVEKSRKAFRFLRKNLALNTKDEGINATAVRQDIFKFKPTFRCDLLISNPPYIKSKDMKLLSKEVKNEPKMALDGGMDGLRFYKKICQNAKDYINKGGRIMFEIGFDEAKAVTSIMENSGFSNVTTLKDLGGNDRVVFGDLLN